MHSELAELRADPDPRSRGLRFQDYFAGMLRHAHFAVEARALRSKGRQVDLFASRADIKLLVETKWLTRPVGIAEVDDLLIRLEKAAPSVVALLVSMSGFTKSVTPRVEEHSHRPILLLEAAEVDAVANDQEDLLALLRRKLDSLVVHRKVLSPSLPRSRGRGTKTQSPTYAFIGNDGWRSEVLECDGSFSPLVFSQGIADLDWSSSGGRGVVLDLELGWMTQDGLLRTFEYLHELGWITPAGTWRIAQSATSWNGFGMAALVEAVRGQRARYGAREVHHSEELRYVDVCEGGFYTVSASVAAFEPHAASQVVISFQLDGIPLDEGGLRELAARLHLRNRPAFRPRSEQSVRRYRPARRVAEMRIQPVGLVGRNDLAPDLLGAEPAEWVVGVVIKNPFSLSHASAAESDAVAELARASELVVCSLRSWHLASETKSYRVEYLEHAWSSDVLVTRCCVDWLG
jgi:hypothetical protein